MADISVFPTLVVAGDPDVIDDPLNERLLEEEDAVEDNLRYEISSYGADYDVEGLVKRLRNGDAKIPEFQRGYVWPIKQASRFIESLLLGLPVPGIFLSTEPETKKLLVIDGHQRLTTLLAFYEGVFPTTKREFGLTDVQSSLEGKTYKGLDDENRRALDNAIIHATVVKQTDPQDGGSGIYKIFERLNSSGMLLSPQEIRTAIYGGELAKLLSELNEWPQWRALFGPENKRMRDQELILRFCALSSELNTYTRPMKTFLNDFMNSRRSIDSDMKMSLSNSFKRTTALVYEMLGARAFKPANSFNAAVFDAIAIGIAHRLRAGEIRDPAELVSTYQKVMEDKNFKLWTSRSTADDETLKKRLAFAHAEFAGVR